MKTRDQALASDRQYIPDGARFQPSTIDEENRTIEMVWTTGAKVRRRTWLGDAFDEELVVSDNAVRMDRLSSGQMNLLDSHNGYGLRGVLGVVEKAWLEKGEGRATVRFSMRDEVEGVWNDVRNGIIQNVSVGYSIHGTETIEREGEVTLIRVTDWEPMEISLVPVPADAGAGTRSATEDPHKSKELDMPETVKEERAEPKEVETRNNPPVQPVDTDAVKREAIAAERQRGADIRALALPHVGRGIDDAFVTGLVDDGASVDEARKKILDKLATASEETEIRNTQTVQLVADEVDKWQRGAAISILQRAGEIDILPEGERDPGEFRGMNLFDLARDSLEMQGVNTRGMERRALVGMAFTRATPQGQANFAILLENVMHKTLLAGYARQPDTWSEFCKTGSVSDFRPHIRYKYGAFGPLDAVGENGEIKAKHFLDGEKELINAATVGNLLSITRAAIINDDLSVFSDISTMLGRASKLSIEVSVYALLGENSGAGPTLNSGTAMFHADHGNVLTAAAPSVDSFDDARVQMSQQKDVWGNEFLALTPSIWLGPMALGGKARVTNGSEHDPDITGKIQIPNKVRNQYSKVIDTPRLTGTAWYSFADPSVAPTIEVVFLDGVQEPYLESRMGWNVDGTEWKVRLDYGVGGVDYRGGQRNAGA